MGEWKSECAWQDVFLYVSTIQCNLSLDFFVHMRFVIESVTQVIK